MEAKIKDPIKKADKSRIAIFSGILSILSMILLHTYANGVQEFIVKVNEKNAMANVTWLLEHLTIALPVVLLAVALTAIYCNKDKYVPVATQREKMYIALFTALFTYAVMLPYVYFKSKNGETADAEELEAVETLWEITYKWFFVQVIPFLILISYHAVRADSERREIEAEEE